MNTVWLESIDDARVNPFRDLRTERALHREGLFIAEGEWLLQRLAVSRCQLQSVLCSESCVKRVQPYVPTDCPLYVLPKDLVAQVVGFPFHRGVLACAKRPSLSLHISEVMTRGAEFVTIVACPLIADPVNLGRIVRLSAGFGVDGLLISTRCADEFSRRALRVSMGASLNLPIMRTHDFDAQLRHLKQEYGCTLAGTVLGHDAIDLRCYQRPMRMVLLLGTEGFGLPPETLDLCDDLISIRIQAELDSLNVSDAAAIFLYELSTQKYV